VVANQSALQKTLSLVVASNSTKECKPCYQELGDVILTVDVVQYHTYRTRRLNFCCKKFTSLLGH
jgi:hypothetical protein